MSNPSNDAQVLMAYQANQKSIGIAYLLWFFLGSVGAHRFYLGRTGSAVAMLSLFLLGWILIWAMGLGLLLLVPLGIWVLVDALLIPGIAHAQNNQLASHLSATTTAPTSGVDELAKYAALRDSGAISSDEYESQKRRILGVL